MYNSIEIAERIREISRIKNIVIKDMLNEIGLGKNTLMNFKTSMPKADTLARIADYLQCSVDYLLGRTNIREINKLTSDSGGFVPLHDDVIRPMVGVAAAGKPLSMTVGCYDMIRISAVSDKHKKISPQDFVVEIHGDSMIDAGIFDGDYAVIHPCPAADNGQIALVAVGEDCTLKRFYRTTGGVELHPCNPDHEVQRYRLSDEIRIMGLFVCTCTGDIIEE